MNPQTFEIAVGDTGPSIVENLRNADNSPINLTGGSVHFRLYDASGVLVIDRAAVVVDAPNGQVRYDWQAGDTATGGTFFRRWRCTLASGQIESVPTEDGLDGYPVLIIDPAAALSSGRMTCQAWCADDDVVLCAPCAGASFDPSLMATAIDVASDILFLLSGRQYPGICSDTIRPCRVEWFGGRYVGSVNILTGEVWGGGPQSRWDGISERNLSWGPVSEIRLPGYPVTAITEVRVDGTVLAPTAYRVADDRFLVRVDGQMWPCGQDLSRDPLTEADTCQIIYGYGNAVPLLGRRAAAAYACQWLLAAGLGQGECTLPPRVQSIARSGLSVQVADPQDYVDNGRTGVLEADRFLKAVNPHGLRERASVYTPELLWGSHRLR